MASGKSNSRRMTVNAAFLRDIKVDNAHLKVLLERIGPIISHQQKARNHWRELVASLNELRDQLAFHFSLEEAYGYFDSAIDAKPHLSAKAERLRGEHERLFSAIRDLADLANETTPDREEPVIQLLRLYNSFYKSFTTHEEAELELILDALEDDIGVGD